jgi:hypothetical protein
LFACNSAITEKVKGENEIFFVLWPFSGASDFLSASGEMDVVGMAREGCGLNFEPGEIKRARRCFLDGEGSWAHFWETRQADRFQICYGS